MFRGLWLWVMGWGGRVPEPPPARPGAPRAQVAASCGPHGTPPGEKSPGRGEAVGWGDGMGGHIPKLPPSPIFVWGVRVSHGATRCHQEPAVRCALGPGAAAETWSTPGTWSTLEHLRMWNTHGTQSTPRSQSTLGAGAPQELEHPPGACQVLEQPVGPGPAAQGRAVPHKAPSLRKGLWAPSGLFLPTQPAKTPPGAPSSTAASPLHWALTWGSASPHHHQEKSLSLVETQHRRSVRSLHHSRAPGAAAPNPRPCRNAAGELLRAASRRCHSQIPADGIDRVSWKGPTKITRSY